MMEGLDSLISNRDQLIKQDAAHQEAARVIIEHINPFLKDKFKLNLDHFMSEAEEESVGLAILDFLAGCLRKRGVSEHQ